MQLFGDFFKHYIRRKKNINFEKMYLNAINDFLKMKKLYQTINIDKRTNFTIMMVNRILLSDIKWNLYYCFVCLYF